MTDFDSLSPTAEAGTFKRTVKLDLDSKPFFIDFSLVDPFVKCGCIDGLVQDCTPTDKSIMELYKEEKNLGDESIRRYFSPKSFYTSTDTPSNHSKEILLFPDMAGLHRFRNFVRSLVIQDPKESTKEVKIYYKFQIAPTNTFDPINPNIKYVADLICPVRYMHTVNGIKSDTYTIDSFNPVRKVMITSNFAPNT